MKPLTRTNQAVVASFVFLLAGLFLAGCGLSLAEDITPPPNYKSPTPDTQLQETVSPGEQVSAVLPVSSADLVQGKAIYTEKCLPCHGETGMGDGPQSGNLPNPAAPLGSPDLARSSRPVDWYTVVTNGNMEKFMPGFTSLSDADRWNVVTYAFSLSASQVELDQGKALFSKNCAECHGESGRGDGEKAASLSTKLVDWTVPSSLAQLSGVDMVNLLAQGKGEMPAYNQLDEAQRWSLASYTRSLSFTRVSLENAVVEPKLTGTPGPSATNEAAAPQAFTITGKLVNATNSAALPSDATVSLEAFNGMSPAFTLDGTLQADGSYQFEDVEYNANYVYLVRVSANGVTFNSEVVHGSDIQGSSVDLPVEVYDTSTDTSVLKADRLHVFFDFSQSGVIQVIELFIISNPSNQVIVAPSPDQAVLTFDLPEGAANLRFEDSTLGERYIQTDHGFGDRVSIAPGMGQHQILFAYELPYSKKLDLNLVSPVSVDAAIVMLPQDGVKLKSSQMVDAGARDVQGTSYQMYNATSAIAPGQPIKLQLSGEAGSSGGAGSSDTTTLVIVSGVVFALVLLGGVWWFLRQYRALNNPVPEIAGGGGEEQSGETSDSLMDAIVALDDLYQAGKLPEKAYQQRRAELKASLTELLRQEGKL